jgi:hypothetical protein
MTVGFRHPRPVGLVALGRLPIQALTLRPHSLYFFIQRVGFFVAQCAFRFHVASTQFFQSFLHGQLSCFSHFEPSPNSHTCQVPLHSDKTT